MSTLTSHRALDTLAAAANRAAADGNNTARKGCKSTGKIGRTSMTAALAAAHKPPRAEVKGRIAPDLDPWFAYVSATAADRAFKATALVASAIAYSAVAR